VILSARSLASMRGWRRNILTVNLLFRTIVFAVAVKLYLIPMLLRLGSGCELWRSSSFRTDSITSPGWAEQRR
jgi:hypothetical protein